MSPADYHDFFLGSVTMGGALVGLLFVAVSVNPGGIGERGDPAKRVQATSALAAFLSPLFISLVALLPSSSIGATAIALGSTGAFTMLSLLLITLRRHRDVSIWSRINMIVLIAGQFAAYVLQIVLGVELLGNPRAAGPFGPPHEPDDRFLRLRCDPDLGVRGRSADGPVGTISQATRSLAREPDEPRCPGRTTENLIATWMRIDLAASYRPRPALEDAGYVEVRKGAVGRRPRTWFRLAAGRQAVQGHLAWLAQLEEAAPPALGRTRQRPAWRPRRPSRDQPRRVLPPLLGSS